MLSAPQGHSARWDWIVSERLHLSRRLWCPSSSYSRFRRANSKWSQFRAHSQGGSMCACQTNPVPPQRTLMCVEINSSVLINLQWATTARKMKKLSCGRTGRFPNTSKRAWRPLIFVPCWRRQRPGRTGPNSSLVKELNASLIALYGAQSGGRQDVKQKMNRC